MILVSKSKLMFRNFKTDILNLNQNGEWSTDPDGKIKLENGTEIIIKNAILEKESGNL